MVKSRGTRSGLAIAIGVGCGLATLFLLLAVLPLALYEHFHIETPAWLGGRIHGGVWYAYLSPIGILPILWMQLESIDPLVVLAPIFAALWVFWSAVGTLLAILVGRIGRRLSS
jgi:hypothetical protein